LSGPADRPDVFLVTGANGDIGEAIARILREAYPFAAVHGCDAGGEWPGRDVFTRMHPVPTASAADYSDRLRGLAGQLAAGCVIPTTEPELRCLADAPAGAAGLPLLMNRPELLRVFLDKLETMRWLKAHGIAAPRTMSLGDATERDLPLVVKPRRSHGSRRVETIRTAGRLSEVQQAGGEDLIAQEYLAPDDAEYTCALLQARGQTRLLAMRRVLQGGLSGRVTVESVPAIEDLLGAIAASAGGDLFLNVQLRMTTQGPRVFEINPRFSSTVMMRHRLGFQDLVWAIQSRAGVELPDYRVPVGARVFRMSREVVVTA
jgi:carbamoyl-phosphate synthase large subunit